MMTVNAFWFGFLIAVVVILVLLLAVAFASSMRNEEEGAEIDISPEEYKELLEKATGKKMRVFRDRHGYLVGEAIEDPDDDEAD